MLVPIKDILQDAVRRRYAVGAFNTVNLEVTLAIIRAAVAQGSPVIVQVSERTLRYADVKPITDVIRTVARHVGGTIPVALHFDHGKSFAAVRECVDAGFSSVHLDASDLPFEDNIAATAQAVKYAHRAGVWVQGELGRIFGQEGKAAPRLPRNASEYLTDPRRVREYVERTGVDSLAVSIGTMHGAFRGKERLDLRRLQAIARAVKIPLVLHGGSGVLAREAKAAISRGVRIINVDTELRMAFTAALRRALGRMRGHVDLRLYLGPATAAVQRLVEQKLALFGSAGRFRGWK